MRRSAVGVCFAVICVALLVYATRGAKHSRSRRSIPAPTAASLTRGASQALTLTAGRTSPRKSAVVQSLERLPMAFEPNVGQTSPQVKFLARGNGYIAFLTPGKAVLELREPAKRTDGVAKQAAPLMPAPIEATSLSMELEGANTNATLAPVDKLPGISNYITGKNAADWHTNIATFRRVSERGVYPGIDLVYYGTQERLEYDFVVAPGAEPKQIRLKIDGARKLSVSEAGTLEARIAGGAVEFHKPVAYQELNGTRRLVDASYVVESSRQVALRVGRYDRSLPLVIDPVLSYSTYLGGNQIDVANGIAVAPDDTAFVAGGTLSSNYPTANAYQAALGGDEDAFVTKLSADGATLIYSTYLGGHFQDIANGIAVDATGQAYVTGATISPDFPFTALSADPNCGGDAECGASWNQQGNVVSNGFVTKLNVTGTGLVYSTSVGVYEHVSSHAIAVDANGIAYITGEVEAALPVTITPPPVGCPGFFPITSTAFEKGYPGGAAATSDGCPYISGGAATSAFVTAISANGASYLYSSYLGGTVQDVGFGIAADNTGDAFVAGLSYSPDFPILNGVDTSYGGLGDGFFAKVKTNGTTTASLLYSTYLGGAGLDQANAVAIDGSGNAYVAGATASANLPFPTLNSYQGDSDGFIAKLNPSTTGGGSLIYFRYLGGSLADGANGIAVDSSNNVYVTGSTTSQDFPVVGEAFQPEYAGGNADAFVTKIDPSGATIIYSSYLGGTNTDIGNGIAVDAAGSAFVAGETCSLDFPLAHPVQPNSGGNCDAFVSKVQVLSGLLLSPAGLVFPAQSVGTTSTAQTVTVTDGDSPVTINSITITGGSASEFAQTNTCPASLSPGQSCEITVTFTPTTTGLAKAALEISDSAPGSPQVVSLNGSTSTLALSASTINFGNEQVGQTAEPQTIIATNDGTVAITFTGITASGAFSETNDCTKAPLQPTTNCSITVSFTPKVAGQSIGALEISDSAPGSPQEVLLYGTGTGLASDFTLSAAPPSVTVNAGQAAEYTLTMGTTGGFSSPVSLSCSGLPAEAACEVASNPVTPGGSTTVALAITTAVRTTVPPLGPSAPLGPPSRLRLFVGLWLGVLMVLLLMSTLIPAFRPRQRAVGVFALAVTLTLLSAACNGGTQKGVPAGTPAGTYQVTITGTSGSISHAANVSLQVK